MAESGNMFFDQYNKVFPEMQEKVVPLALKKMELDMETEKFNIAKKKVIEERQKAQDFAKYLQGESVTQEITQPDLPAVNFKPSFGAAMPLSEGVQGLTSTQTFTKPRTREEIFNKALELGILPVKDFLSLSGNVDDETTDIKNYKFGITHPDFKKEGGNTSFQEKGVSEKGGYTVSYDPKAAKNFVTLPDATREDYDPTKHGKILSTSMPHAAFENTKNSFSTWTPEAKKQEFMEHLITGVPPVNTRGMMGGDRKAYAQEFAQWKVDSGFSPQDIALIKTDYQAGNMSLKNMKKQEAPMAAFVGNINRQISKVEELYKADDRLGLRLLDLPIRELRVRAKGSGDEAVKASYLLEISNEIGKLSSGASASVQQLSDSAKEDWKKVHDVNLSMSEIMKVVNATRDQANMRLQTWKEAGEGVRTMIQYLGTDNGSTPVPKPNGAPDLTMRPETPIEDIMKAFNVDRETAQLTKRNAIIGQYKDAAQKSGKAIPSEKEIISHYNSTYGNKHGII